MRAARLRWDRLGRLAMLCVLCVLLYLYIGPLRSLVSAVGRSGQAHAQVATLQRENAGLQAQARALQSPGTLDVAARRLGLVLPGERPYVISGLPNN